MNFTKINNFKRYPVLVENFITQICLRTERLKRKSSDLYYLTENRSNLNGGYGAAHDVIPYFMKSHIMPIFC